MGVLDIADDESSRVKALTKTTSNLFRVCISHHIYLDHGSRRAQLVFTESSQRCALPCDICFSNSKQILVGFCIAIECMSFPFPTWFPMLPVYFMHVEAPVYQCQEGGGKHDLHPSIPSSKPVTILRGRPLSRWLGRSGLPALGFFHFAIELRSNVQSKKPSQRMDEKLEHRHMRCEETC